MHILEACGNNLSTSIFVDFFGCYVYLGVLGIRDMQMIFPLLLMTNSETFDCEWLSMNNYLMRRETDAESSICINLLNSFRMACLLNDLSTSTKGLTIAFKSIATALQT